MTGIVLTDVSRHQGPVDWQAYAAAAGTRHATGLTCAPAAVIKATGGTETSGGTSWVDTRFAENRLAMRHLLKVRGYYHFLQIDGDPVAQARHFARVVGPLTPGEFAVLDVEQDRHADRHEAFCREVDRILGGVCWLYGGKDVPNPHGRPYWVARYPKSLRPDPAMEPSLPHVLWQFSSQGRFPGVTGDVDLNVHRGDLASLARYAIPAPEQQEDDMTADEFKAILADALEPVKRVQAAQGKELDTIKVNTKKIIDGRDYKGVVTNPGLRDLAAAIEDLAAPTSNPGSGKFVATFEPLPEEGGGP